jgi:signal transduction histidine kinase
MSLVARIQEIEDWSIRAMPPFLRVRRLAIQKLQKDQAPLRAELARPVFWFAFPGLMLQALLLWVAGMPANRLGFVSGFPLLWLIIAAVTRRSLPPLSMTSLFMSLVLGAVLPVNYVPYPQYGGVIAASIVLAGLLIGKFYVPLWTLVACVLQIAMVDTTDWTWKVHVGWIAIYLVTGWMVTTFSSHLERFVLAKSAAEEQQRSAIVAERTRFARDIHDTLAQGFTGIMMQLNAAEQRLPEASEAQQYVSKARQTAQQSLEEARRSVTAMRSGALANGTLLGAIEQIGRTLTAGSKIQLVTRLEGQPYALEELREGILLRIAQEGLTNAVRHSSASQISVRLAYRTGAVILEVEDNGTGLDGREPAGYGIDGMRQRAREAGADLEFQSKPAMGTRIVVTMPNA